MATQWTTPARVLVGAIAMLALAASADTPEERGLAIAQEADRRDTGWGDIHVSLTMINRNSLGDESTREMRLRSIEIESDGDKSLIIFDSPRDQRGTGLLSFAHKVATDDQWLYLPALKRVKKIASSNRSGPFASSEFAYEDLTSQEVEKFGYRFIEDGRLDENDCFIIERAPVDRFSGYTRQIVWIDKQEYRVQKVEYYDRKGVLLKTLKVDGYVQYKDQFWRPEQMSMHKHQTGRSNDLEWRDYQFDSGLDENRDFSTNSLRRIR